jgi:hypothetical protein
VQGEGEEARRIEVDAEESSEGSEGAAGRRWVALWTEERGLRGQTWQLQSGRITTRTVGSTGPPALDLTLSETGSWS